MDRKWVTFKEAGMLAPITRAYLEGDERVEGLFAQAPGPSNVPEIIAARQAKFNTQRKVLTASLRAQYRGFDSTKAVKNNLESLQRNETFTVTTGHQLNLFTGPLYFIYKILSVIRASEELNRQYPEYHFVPVYWMATEDHDFAEINHTWIFNRLVEWRSEQKGMVGQFDPSGVAAVLEELKEILGNSADADDLIATFSDAYLHHANLADAMRYIVDQWFGKYGVVVVDGNCKELKKLFTPVVKRELTGRVCRANVEKTLEKFGNNFKPQVTPRELNLFYVHKEVRARIVPSGSGFEVLDTGLKFSETEMLKLVEEFPERISPNVLLRPVYQEVILPNVMYFGGGAEVAYWLELKGLFDTLEVSYPLIQLRNSFVVMDHSIQRKIAQLDLELPEIFRPEETLMKRILSGKNPLEERFNEFETDMHILMESMTGEIADSETTLGASFESMKAKIQRQLSRMEKKIHRDFKKQNDTERQRIRAIKQAVFPHGVLQERRTNISEMIIRFGPDFIEKVKNQTEPFTEKLAVLFA